MSQSNQNPPQHYAFVSNTEPLELPAHRESTQSEYVPQQRSRLRQQQPHEMLTEIYQSYAERYPNPRLTEEYQERDQLLQATSAAHSANPRQQRASTKGKKGWLSSLFGGGGGQENEKLRTIPTVQAEEEEWLEYTEVDVEDHDNTLCGTRHSLDRSCIPLEAHSMARLSLVSSRTRRERPLVVRPSPHFPGEMPTLVIVDLGVIAEFRSSDDQSSASQCTVTSDRQDLIQYAKPRGFDLARVRAASVGPNFMVISWGFSDGIVVFYRRIALENSDIAWEAVVFLGPSQAVLDHSYDAYVDEEDEDANSALLRITDIVPLVVTTPGLPATALAVSRLGGYIEVLPVPPPLWHGPELQVERHKPRGRRKRNAHYAKPYLVDVASDKAPIPILALTTMEYHVDTLCLEAIRTRVTMDTIWDRELYGNAPPPAEFILVASGTQNGNEILTFWAISYMFADEPPKNGSAGFTLHAVLQEALDVGPVGPDLTIFANGAILNQWRQPRKVSLREQPPAAVAVSEDGDESTHEEDKITDDNPKKPSVYDRVTTISVPAPIVAMQSITIPVENSSSSSSMVLLSLLDWNGSITVMDCSFLERMVSHSLAEEEYGLLHDTDKGSEDDDERDPTALPAFVKTLVNRNLMMQWIKSSIASSNGILYHCVNVQWLARAESETEPWMVLLSAPQNSHTHQSRMMIMSGFLGKEVRLEDLSIQTVLFPTYTATLQGNILPIIGENGGRSSSPLRIVFPAKKHANRLCICFLQPLESQDIITSLALDGKYKQALTAAQELNTEEKRHVKDTMEECRQKLWEQTGDLEWLEQVTDDAYVVKQALSLFENSATGTGREFKEDGGGSDKVNNDTFDLEKCRAICSLALGRVGKLRLGGTLLLGHGSDDARVKLQGMLVGLGTYQLLCQALHAEGSFPRFRQMFARVSLVDLAKSFATVADLTALSILFFRHSPELQPHLVEILDHLPMTLDPTFFCHLLPVISDPKEPNFERSHSFIAADGLIEESKLQHISQLPSHVEAILGFTVVINRDDEKIVLEYKESDNNSEFVIESEDVCRFYVSRAIDMQKFSSNLQHVIDFCVLGLLATGTSLEDLNTDPTCNASISSDSQIFDLYNTWGCAVSLRRMLVESIENIPMEAEDSGLSDLEPFTTVTPLDLVSMELVDIVKMVLGGQDDPQIIFETYTQYLLPLLKFLPALQNQDLDDAIKAYCVDVVRSSVCHYIDVDHKDELDIDTAVINDEEDGILKAVQICSAIAVGSRTSIRKYDRIITEKKVLISFVLTAIFEISLRCESVPIPNQICRTIVNLMWNMYESLPVGTGDKEEQDEELKGLITKADCIFQDLVGIDLLSQWPDAVGCAFSFLISRIRSRGDAQMEENGHDPEMREVSDDSDLKPRWVRHGQEALATLCRCFCSLSDRQEDVEELATLVKDLKSDIENFSQICYDKEASFQQALVDTISSELIAPLFRKSKFELVASLLSDIDNTWWNKEQEARMVRNYVDEVIFSDERTLLSPSEGDALQSAMACQDALGPHFPELQAHFEAVRRYLDAAHFINTVIFAELRMPKPIKPNDLRGDLPLDVIESILRALPKAIVIGCKEWGEGQLAVHANKALRDFQEAKVESAQDVEPTNLPPIPGGAVFHLAGILGLEDTASVLAVKSRVVHYGVASGLYGASAAVCRTILYDSNAFLSAVDSTARLGAVAEVVTRDEFGDLATKRELCAVALQKHQGRMSVESVTPFEAILAVYASLEFKTSHAQNGEGRSQILNLPTPPDSMGCLYNDTWAQYSVNIYDLFATLQQHTSSCTTDDSLLNAMSRYVFFCCIFRSTRPRSELPGKLEKATWNQLLVLGAAFLLHIEETTTVSVPAVKELRQILEKQAMAVINQHPTAFQDLVKLPNEGVVRQLVERGFTPLAARRSALATNNKGVQQALQWGVANARNPRMNDPIVFVSSPRRFFVDKQSIQQIMNAFAFSGQFLSGAKSPGDWIAEHSIQFPSESQRQLAESNTAGISSAVKSQQMHADGKAPYLSAIPPEGKKSLGNQTMTATGPQPSLDAKAAPVSAPPSKPEFIPGPPPSPKTKIAPLPPPEANAAAAPLPPPEANAAAAPLPPPEANAAAAPLPPSEAKAAAASLSRSQPKAAPAPPPDPEPKTFPPPAPRIEATLAPTTAPVPPPKTTAPAAPQALSASEGPVAPAATETQPVSRPSDLKTTVPPASTPNKLATPTNQPTSLKLASSTGSTTSFDYESLKKRGEVAMAESKRSSPRNHERNREERKRLIEAGRRLLARSRASNPASPASVASKPSFGGVATASSTETTAPSTETTAPSKTASSISKMSSLGYSTTARPPSTVAPQITANASTSPTSRSLLTVTRPAAPAQKLPSYNEKTVGIETPMVSTDHNNENGWDEDLGDIENAMDGSNGWGFNEQPTTQEHSVSATAATHDAEPSVEKLPKEDDDGWDFDDF